MNALPLLFYTIAAVAYAVHFARRAPHVGRIATGAIIGGAVAHTFVLGMQTVQVGYVPLAGTTAAVSVFVWLLALSYLSIEMSTDERAVGVFMAPLLVLLQILPATQPAVVAEQASVLESPWFVVHVLSLLFAYASFALACVIGITYVLLFKEIKTKHLGFFYARLPPLRVLDLMNDRAVTVGWIFLTIGVIIGGFWAATVPQESADPRLRAMSVLDPKIFVALICWVVYSFALFARHVIDWTGRRAAWLSAVGFAIVLLNLVPVGYFLTKSHNF